MTATVIRGEALTAAALALVRADYADETDPGAFYRARARVALEAAAPLIAAAERDRIKSDAADLGQGQLRSQAWWFKIIDGGAP